MTWAVITLTKGGLQKAEEIKNKLNYVDIYSLPKWNDSKNKHIKGSLSDFVGDIFNKYDTLVFIMSTGIVVRVIAKYIQDKTKDPAVLVMDEKGKYIISLLSGHIGGGNEAAIYLSEKIGGSPVITTASDVNDVIAVDMLAKKLGCYIDNMIDAKDITAKIVNSQIVGIKSDIKISIKLPDNVICINKDYDDYDIEGIIYITNKRNINCTHSTVHLIPKNIVIGIGCKKGISGERIVKSIKLALDRYKLHPKSVKMIATIDIKEHEKGILDAAFYFEVPIKIISKDEIKSVQDKFQLSNFVNKSVGVGAVCEPCGYLASGKGKSIMKKTSFDGITLSIWEEIQ